jgi:hypothetical protein
MHVEIHAPPRRVLTPYQLLSAARLLHSSTFGTRSFLINLRSHYGAFSGARARGVVPCVSVPAICEFSLLIVYTVRTWEADLIGF